MGSRWIDGGRPCRTACESSWCRDAVPGGRRSPLEVDFVFCAVDMPKAEIKALEEAYARAECPVVSNNSAHRLHTGCSHGHSGNQSPSMLEIIPVSAQTAGHQTGLYRSEIQLFAAKLCSRPLPSCPDLGVEKGTGLHLPGHFRGRKDLCQRWPEMVDNVIPYIGGEEEKSEQEPLKIWGKL